jgi:hypothetical protein
MKIEPTTFIVYTQTNILQIVYYDQQRSFNKG